ncbi:hypothetical protein V2I01_25380 [Micromonospora sp. BRA006-A]|nr:hypothetical protein [Micromonospora sp. BRA006-A]
MGGPRGGTRRRRRRTGVALLAAALAGGIAVQPAPVSATPPGRTALDAAFVRAAQGTTYLGTSWSRSATASPASTRTAASRARRTATG